MNYKQQHQLQQHKQKKNRLWKPVKIVVIVIIVILTIQVICLFKTSSSAVPLSKHQEQQKTLPTPSTPGETVQPALEVPKDMPPQKADEPVTPQEEVTVARDPPPPISERVLTATDDDEWVPLREEHTRISVVQVRKAQTSLRPLVLVTSYYNARDPERAKELDSSLEDNIMSGVFDEIHVLYDPDTDTVPNSFIDIAAEAAATVNNGKENVFFVEAKAGEVSGMEDRFKVSTSNAYMYSDFFAYANKNLNGKIVVISNTDILFDKSVDNVKEALSTQEMWDHAFALSRVSPACPGVKCKNVFCKRSLCLRNIASYDAFAFVPPVPEGVILNTNHKQDQKGAENIVVAELDHYGFTVINPCKSVTLTHRHCVRNVTAYLDKPILNDGRYGGAKVVKFDFYE